MSIKATRIQVWAPAGGGGGGKSRPSPPPPPENRKRLLGYISGIFATFSSWPVCCVLLILGGLFTMWGSFCYFLLHVGGLFVGLPAPHHLRKISAGAHDCKKGSRACSPKKFLCDRNLVSSGHVLLRFCLKNDKNNDKL